MPLLGRRPAALSCLVLRDRQPAHHTRRCGEVLLEIASILFYLPSSRVGEAGELDLGYSDQDGLAGPKPMRWFRAAGAGEGPVRQAIHATPWDGWRGREGWMQVDEVLPTMLRVRPLNTTSTYIPTEPTYERHMHHSCIIQ